MIEPAQERHVVPAHHDREHGQAVRLDHRGVLVAPPALEDHEGGQPVDLADLGRQSLSRCWRLGPMGFTLLAMPGSEAPTPLVSSLMRRCSAISRAVLPPVTSVRIAASAASWEILPDRTCPGSRRSMLLDWPT